MSLDEPFAQAKLPSKPHLSRSGTRMPLQRSRSDRYIGRYTRWLGHFASPVMLYWTRYEKGLMETHQVLLDAI